MPRYYTLAEAELMLPEVDRALRDALFHKSEYQTAEEELNRNTQRIRMAGGSRVNPGPFLAMRSRRDTSRTDQAMSGPTATAMSVSFQLR